MFVACWIWVCYNLCQLIPMSLKVTHWWINFIQKCLIIRDQQKRELYSGLAIVPTAYSRSNNFLNELYTTTSFYWPVKIMTLTFLCSLIHLGQENNSHAVYF